MSSTVQTAADSRPGPDGHAPAPRSVGAPVTEAGGPAGDLQLMPDPSAVRILTADPGWAWAPADQYTQDGRLFGCCQRSFARRMTDLAAVSDPYLAIGSVIAAGLAGIEHRLSLPPEVAGDPATDPGPAHAARPLPSSLEAALAALRRSEIIPEAMGPVLCDAFTAVRAAEAETFGGLDPDTIAAAHRWLY